MERERERPSGAVRLLNPAGQAASLAISALRPETGSAFGRTCSRHTPPRRAGIPPKKLYQQQSGAWVALKPVRARSSHNLSAPFSAFCKFLSYPSPRLYTNLHDNRFTSGMVASETGFR